MDANGQRFWILADERHFPARLRTVWDAQCRVLRLASERTLPPPANLSDAQTAAANALERIPATRDEYGAVAHWIEKPDADDNVGMIVAKSPHLPSEAERVRLQQRPSDIALGYDDVLYIAVQNGVVLHDLRGRWTSVLAHSPSFKPWRIAAAPSGGAWLLERTSGRIARVTGMPLADRPHLEYAHTTFRPSPENPRPPAIRLLDAIEWPDGEKPVAIAAHADGGVALLSWRSAGDAYVRFLDTAREKLGPALSLVNARYAYAVEWLDKDRIVVRVPLRTDAPSFAVDDGENDETRACLGEIYPLAADAVEGPFVHGVSTPPHYETTSGGSEPLHALSLSNLARHGEAASFTPTAMHVIDSGSQQTVWHRLYAEASLPPGSGLIVYLAASADPEPPQAPTAWCAHRFGSHIPLDGGPHEPHAVWEPFSSELPSHPGLGPWPMEKDVCGLFSVLIQDARKRVRSVAGRYLWVKLELFGDGRAGPEIAALRAWGSRFSYRDHYLPRIYRETLYGPSASIPGERVETFAPALAAKLDTGGAPPPTVTAQMQKAGFAVGAAAQIRVEEPGAAWLLADSATGRSWRIRREPHAIACYRPAATPADFLERYLAMFEGVLTTLEDRVAAAHVLTDPAGVPEGNLDWLAAWIGIAFHPALPVDRRREWLQAAPKLAQYHGSKRGLELALDVATGGGVRGGEIIVLEDFRLRRLFATLLGVDLADETDPLLPGLTVSGNSVVGDTLILGEAAKVELLALFRADVATLQENAAVRAFYERLAHRATVLVHQNVEPQDLGLIRRIVELEAPAHVETRVQTATWPFLVGVASLVGVDSYLGPRTPPRPVRVQVSGIGLGDFVLGLASLDPRMSGASAPSPPPPRPIADAGTDKTTPWGKSFDLDGSESRAGPGREIATYRWRRDS
ncbi:MAG TPA: phage tail protein [Burkholderiales bacterium]|nr:phage tail protein [Burkholderiales bacterium]